jgi:hypothetical protein
MRSLKLFVMSLLVLGSLSVGTALADPSGGGVPNPSGPKIKGTGQVSNPAVETEDQVQGQNSSSTLPFTGADITLFFVIGIGAIGAGLFFLQTSRRAQRGPTVTEV